MAPLFLLKTLICEFQRSAILRNHPHNMIRRARWDIRLDLEGYRDFGANKPCQVRDNFIRDATCVTSDARGVQLCCPVEAPGLRRFWWKRFFIIRSRCYVAAAAVSARVRHTT